MGMQRLLVNQQTLLKHENRRSEKKKKNEDSLKKRRIRKLLLKLLFLIIQMKLKGKKLPKAILKEPLLKVKPALKKLLLTVRKMKTRKKISQDFMTGSLVTFECSLIQLLNNTPL